jgi:hypothetical protein
MMTLNNRDKYLSTVGYLLTWDEDPNTANGKAISKPYLDKRGPNPPMISIKIAIKAREIF